MRRHALKPIATLALCHSLAVASEARFGELPSGSVATVETHGVSAEICREHLFNPGAAGISLPQGYRLTLVADMAQKNPSIGLLLRANPQVHDHALGVLCFLSAHKLVVEGSPRQIITPAVQAFWWGAVEGPRHPGMRGKVQWVQLGSWYAPQVSSRAAVLKADPMADFAELTVEEVASHHWRLRLVLPGEVVSADVRSSSVGTPSAASAPAFMSVPMSGRSKGYFTVYTYFGHVHRFAQGTWRATGAGVFTQAFGLAGDGDAFDTVFQEGWASRSGLYSFSAP